ncbi:MAG TPA: YdeI/OmpD-associated family protein [Candidatus Paceibacterota bacterium]
MPAGTVHKMPRDLLKVLTTSKVVKEAWEDITPLARNEWICWIESAKKLETRSHRIERTQVQLMEGKRRPCCWAGCPHR